MAELYKPTSSSRAEGLKPLDRAQHLARKVPEITIYFWIVKLLTTAMGEATSDFFVFRINEYLAVFLGGIALLIALALQFSVHRYVAWVYWLTVSMVAVFGTMAADGLHIQLGVPYVVSTTFFAVVLVIVFRVWYKTEKTLSIHTINSPRRELFYWATVLATFALGTAAGDMTATTFGLGYFSSIILFAVIMMVVAGAYKIGFLGEITAFWLVYILTRPVGASIADWLSKSRAVGGLDYGNGHVAIVLTLIIIGFVAYLTISRKDVKQSSRVRQRAPEP